MYTGHSLPHIPVMLKMLMLKQHTEQQHY